jgi:hypothetical protein
MACDREEVMGWQNGTAVRTLIIADVDGRLGNAVASSCIRGGGRRIERPVFPVRPP